jgi:hypothetical protein
MGESSGTEICVQDAGLESFSVETPGGRIHIRWDYEASATPNAQLAFFAEFVATAGVYESWIDSCPLRYANSSGGDQHKRDALGTWFLSILAGHHRYAHITALRSDEVSPQILGMSKIVSEDALRRALARLSTEQSRDWLRPALAILSLILIAISSHPALRASAMAAQGTPQCSCSLTWRARKPPHREDPISPVPP